ncbi:MAG: hypothetical protein NTU87_01575, partial [Verrucomicrobia bacterium]|nr:hypothetical protein [Verrucomicrobiota bacterium]
VGAQVEEVVRVSGWAWVRVWPRVWAWAGWGLVRALRQELARVAQMFLIFDFGFRMRVELA